MGRSYRRLGVRPKSREFGSRPRAVYSVDVPLPRFAEVDEDDDEESDPAVLTLVAEVTAPVDPADVDAPYLEIRMEVDE